MGGNPPSSDGVPPYSYFPAPLPPSGRDGMGGRSGTQNFVNQKWPDKIFPTVSFFCSHDGHCGLGGGRGVTLRPPMVYGRSIMDEYNGGGASPV